MTTIVKIITLLILLSASLSKAQNPTWTEVAPGVWKTIAGSPDSYNLLNAAGATPNQEALTRMGKIPFPSMASKIVAEFSDGKTMMRFPLEKEEQLYGFGLNFKTVQQRGRILQLHVDHYGGNDNGRTHAPVPFYVSDKGYGIFINSARYITVYAGTAARKESPEAEPPLDRNTNKKWNSQPYSDAVEMVTLTRRTSSTPSRWACGGHCRGKATVPSASR